MTTFKYITSLPLQKCKTVYETTNKSHSNRQWLSTWITNQNISDILTVNFNQFVIPDRQHDLIEFVINPDALTEISQIDSVILELGKFAKKYYFVAVNKFLIYTTKNTQSQVYTTDLDQKLIDHWCQLLGRDLIYTRSDSNDVGMSGNFIYPITQFAVAMS